MVLGLLHPNPTVDVVFQILGVFAAGFAGIRLLTIVQRWFIGRGATLRPVPPRVPPGTAAERQSTALRHETVGTLVFTTLKYAVIAAMIFAALLLVVPDSNYGVLWLGLLVAVIGFAAQTILRDIIAGVMIVAERWFEAGDYVTIEPWQVSGVVESLTLRSTSLRSLSGERVVYHNAQIYGVRVAPRGLRGISLEIYTREPEIVMRMINEVAELLPKGPTYLVQPLTVVETETLAQGLVRIQARAATPPGREWLIEQFAVEALRDRDTGGAIVHGPLAFYTDAVAERRFKRSVTRAAVDA